MSGVKKYMMDSNRLSGVLDKVVREWYMLELGCPAGVGDRGSFPFYCDNSHL